MPRLRYPSIVDRVMVVAGGCRIEATAKDGCTTTAAAVAPLHIQCNIVGADKGRVELVPRWCGGRRGGHRRRLGWAIGEYDVVRGRRLGGTPLPQQNRTSSAGSGSSSRGGGTRIAARGQPTAGYVMGSGVGDQDHVREVKIAVLLR